MALDCLGGLSFSPLEQRLVRDEQVANSVDVGAMGFVDGVSLGLVVADVAEGVDTDALEEQVCAELTAFADEGPTQEQMEAVRAQAERGWLSALAAKDERADIIGHYTCLHDDPGYINTFLDQLAEVTAEDVKAAADRWLRPQSRAAVVYRVVEQEEVA